MPPRLPDPRVGDPDRDDWLGEQGDVDWDVDSDAVESGPPRRSEPVSRSARSGAGALAEAGPRPTGPEAHRLAVVQRRRAIGLVALLALALVGLGVALTVFRDDEPEATPSVTVTAPPPPATPPATATPPPAATTAPLRIQLPDSGPLAFGDRGDEVETLQTALAALDHEPGEVDGVFGDSTQAAVIAFQQANDLKADGIVGPETVRKLNAALAEQGVTE
jgi:Putative peptidoglycan binding domain